MLNIIPHTTLCVKPVFDHTWQYQLIIYCNIVTCILPTLNIRLHNIAHNNTVHNIALHCALMWTLCNTGVYIFRFWCHFQADAAGHCRWLWSNSENTRVCPGCPCPRKRPILGQFMLALLLGQFMALLQSFLDGPGLWSWLSSSQHLKNLYS